MNEQTQKFLDKIPETSLEVVTQRLLSSHTKTHLLQLERSLRNLDRALYTTALKKITITELYAAITYAKGLLCDGEHTESSLT